ncbi:hypothetical protein EV561_13533 [Rhizobium sp. BK376]|nr:hypothetical protein EV561_13533 [Rhizobium sp. BK376]
MRQFPTTHLLPSVPQTRRRRANFVQAIGHRYFSILTRRRTVFASWRGARKAPLASGLNLPPHIQRDIGLTDITTAASDFRDSWKEPGIFDLPRF